MPYKNESLCSKCTFSFGHFKLKPFLDAFVAERTEYQITLQYTFYVLAYPGYAAAAEI